MLMGKESVNKSEDEKVKQNRTILLGIRARRACEWELFLTVACYELCSILLNVANKAISSINRFHFLWTAVVIQNLIAFVVLLVTGFTSRLCSKMVPARYRALLAFFTLTDSGRRGKFAKDGTSIDYPFCPRSKFL